MTEQQALEEALKIIPKYPNYGFCGCGEGWENECCERFTQLMNDENHHCIYDNIKEDNRAKSSISNKQKTKSMKTKKGTAKPSGAGVGKGGPATSPTDGGSLKVKGGKKKK